MWRRFGALWVVFVVLGADGCSLIQECGSWDSFCDGDVLHYCAEKLGDSSLIRERYWATLDCAASSQVCVRGYDSRVSAEVSFCADTAVADPRCSSARPWVRCDADVMIACRAGFLIGSTACTAGARCVTVDPDSGAGECRDAADPCFGTVTGWVCAGDVARWCDSMQERDSRDCPGCTLDDSRHPVSRYDRSCD